MRPGYSVRYRLVLIGDFSVGKTCLLNRFVDDHYTPYGQSTVGADYRLQNYDIDGKTIEIQVCDTAGHEKYRAVSPMYFRDALGAVIVFDLTSRSSFTNLEMWISSFIDVVGAGSVIAIAGNKSDLTAEYQVTVEEGRSFASEKNAFFAATSAKTGDGVRELFHDLIAAVVRRKKESVDTRERQIGSSEGDADACGC
jgi:Ras-related protein Rab-6A